MIPMLVKATVKMPFVLECFGWKNVCFVRVKVLGVQLDDPSSPS